LRRLSGDSIPIGCDSTIIFFLNRDGPRALRATSLQRQRDFKKGALRSRSSILGAGNGATQAVPGPLFTLSAYLGTVMSPEPNGCRGALLAPAAIFLPSFLLVTGALLSKTSYAQNPFPIRSQRHQRGGVGTAASYFV
jgi:hypothetical protein